jgi:C_GCAxxG_C_C family probable redox protein
VGQEKLQRSNGELVKAMGAFGGGVASSGRVCGALLGGIALFSSIYSRDSLDGKEDPRMWRLSFKLNKIFESLTEPYGSADCKDIARINWKDKKAVEAFYHNPDSRRKLCIRLVGDVAHALGELLEQDSAG